jgi:hypothetical protein
MLGYYYHYDYEYDYDCCDCDNDYCDCYYYYHTKLLLKRMTACHDVDLQKERTLSSTCFIC